MVIRQNLNRKLYIFDLDGTLYNLCVDWSNIKSYLRSLSDEGYNSVSDLVDSLPPNERKSALDYIDECEIIGVRNGGAVDDAALVINDLIRRHCHVAIVSRNSRASISLVVKEIGIEDDVYIIGREDVVNQKPDAEGINKVIRFFNIEKKEAIFIGDTYHDVEASKSAKIDSIIVYNPLNEFQPKGANFYVKRLKDILSITI